MTEDTQAPATEEQEERKKDLLDRAALLGLQIHPNAKIETIEAKIRAKLAETDKPNDEEQPAAAQKDDKVAKELHPSKRLRRVIITCNDPQKADQTGDVISVSNGKVGNLRFYFHFNKPWHMPQIILDTLMESKLFLHSSRKEGREIVTREVPRYNIQILPDLTDKERERIAAKQAAALATED